MILHICPPDILFIQSLLSRFERLKPGFNRCVIVVSNHDVNTKLNIDKNLIDYIGPVNQELIHKIKKSNFHGLIIHTLNDDILTLVNNLSKEIPAIWRSWGPDLHDLIYTDFNPLLPYTQTLMSDNRASYETIINLLRPLQKKILGTDKRIIKRISNKLEFLRSVQFVATATLSEFQMLKDRVPDMRAQHLRLNYRAMDIGQLPQMTTHDNSSSTMVGHSSFPYHNHADIFHLLWEQGYNGLLNVPLNYGNKLYGNKVIKLGEKLFNAHIECLTEFLEFEKYFEIIRSCSSFILNSRVQSGGGNIIYHLFNGSKVYLREENPIYKDFKDAGINLFSIQKDLNHEHLSHFSLSESERYKNRQKIESLFNEQQELKHAMNAYKAFEIKL